MVKRSRMTPRKTLSTWALVVLFALNGLTTPAIALNALVQAGPGEPTTANSAAPDPNPENPGSQDPEDPADPQDPDDKKDPIPATVEHLTAKVTLKNHGLTQGQFSFVLKDDKGHTVASGTNDASGKVVLSSFEIAQAGTYTYELSQTGNAASGYTLDTQKFTVAVTVSLTEDKASLIAKVASPSTPMTFANSYLAPNRGWQGSGSSRTFVQDDGSLMKSRVAKIGDNHYLFDGSGKLMANGWKTFQNRRYHATAQGELTSGWLWDGSWYYLDPADNCAMATGWKVVDGAHYYMDMSGRMLSGGWKWLGNRWYYLSSSGAAATGWLRLGSTWYYLDPATAAMRTGWQKVGNAWYYLDGSGAMHANGWMRLGSAWYYLYPSGAMASDWIHVGAWYYLGGPDDGAMKTGWNKVRGAWYYLTGSGAMATGWRWIGNAWYYLNGSGVMLSGWQWIGGAWYYLGGANDGAMRANCWIDNAYWVGPSGAMAANSWVDGGRYYVDGGGRWVPGAMPTTVQGTMSVWAQGYSSATPWLAMVDTSANRVGIYQGSQGHWNQVRFMTCSAGSRYTPTVKGQFTVGNKGYSFGENKGYSCYYWTQFYDGYLFHSILYNPGTRVVQDGRLGQNLSHGCVRLSIDDAYWVQQTLPRGSKVVVY